MAIDKDILKKASRKKKIILPSQKRLLEYGFPEIKFKKLKPEKIKKLKQVKLINK